MCIVRTRYVDKRQKLYVNGREKNAIKRRLREIGSSIKKGCRTKKWRRSKISSRKLSQTIHVNIHEFPQTINARGIH